MMRTRGDLLVGLDAEQLLRVPDEALQVDGQVDARLARRQHLRAQDDVVLHDLLRDQKELCC